MYVPRSGKRSKNSTQNMLRYLCMAEYDANGCLIWPLAKDDKGYGVTTLGGKLVKAHRVVYRMFGTAGELGNLYVLHRCDNRACVNPEHLVPGTAKENMDDKYARGRANHVYGERSGVAKLTDKIVRWLRTENPPITKELAAKLGVHRQVLYHAKWGKTWKHVK